MEFARPGFVLPKRKTEQRETNMTEIESGEAIERKADTTHNSRGAKDTFVRPDQER